jgi:plasmid stabilization system protein ParE
MHAFLSYSRPVRWTGALLLAALYLSVLAIGVALPFLDWRLFLVPLVMIPWLAPLESLLLTPLYVVSGRFRYFSPFLFATRRTGGGLDLHVGTLFDYLLNLRWSDRGPRAARRVTEEMLRGLHGLCEETELGRTPPHTELVATSYFFSDRTLARLGFTLRRPPSMLQHNLVVASLSIALRLSFTRGRPAFPDLRQIRQATTTAGELVRHKETIVRVLHRLRRAPAA